MPCTAALPPPRPPLPSAVLGVGLQGGRAVGQPHRLRSGAGSGIANKAERANFVSLGIGHPVARPPTAVAFRDSRLPGRKAHIGPKFRALPLREMHAAGLFGAAWHHDGTPSIHPHLALPLLELRAAPGLYMHRYDACGFSSPYPAATLLPLLSEMVRCVVPLRWCHTSSLSASPG